MMQMFAVVLIIVVITIDYYYYNNYGSGAVGLYPGVFAWKSIAKPAEIGQRHHLDDNYTVVFDAEVAINELMMTY